MSKLETFFNLIKWRIKAKFNLWTNYRLNIKNLYKNYVDEIYIPKNNIELRKLKDGYQLINRGHTNSDHKWSNYSEVYLFKGLNLDE